MKFNLSFAKSSLKSLSLAPLKSVYLAVAVGASGFATQAVAEDTQDYPFRDHTLPIEERVKDLVSRLTLQEKANLMWEKAPAIERLGIAKYHHGNEALHGVVRPGPFTVFPQAIAFGATFNPDFIEEVAVAISDEARGRWNELEQGKKQLDNHSDLLTFWSPNINMARDPRWGRTAGTYGEDPWLTSRIGVSFVQGLQGYDDKYVKVVSTPKHYVANNIEENRFSSNSVISEKTLREYYLPAFKAAIKEGKAESIMSAYNATNYVPSNASRWLLTDLLRDEWGFDGYVVSDCGGPALIMDAHKWVKQDTDAAAISVRAGMDLECQGHRSMIAGHLPKALEEGKITMDEIDTAVSRVLRGRFRLGMYDPLEANPYNQISGDVVGSEEHVELAREAARQSMVLLQNNNGLLPLDDSKLKSVAVIGHNASKAVFGDYSGYPGYPPITPIQGIEARLEGKAKVNFVNTPLKMDKYSLVDAAYFSHDGGKPGLKAEYYANIKFEGEARVRVDRQIDIHNLENPPDPFVTGVDKSVRWTGYLTAPSSDTYDFAIEADDGARLYLDDKLVVDQWNKRSHKGEKHGYPVKLEAGKKYKVRMEYFDRGGHIISRLYWAPRNPGDVERFVAEKQAAKNSDVVIAVLGTNTNTEREGKDKETLDLPGDQLDMLKEVYAVNKNMIVVLVTGSQHTIGWIKDNIPSVLNAWYPGEQGGHAIADVLFGDYNPAGRTPLTYYENVTEIPKMERYEISEGRTYQFFEGKILWPFGHGLSYSSFDYGDVEAKQEVGKTLVTVDVTNTSDVDGEEVVQVYASFEKSASIRAKRKLVGFKRVAIKAGETKSVTVEVRDDQLAYWSSMDREWKFETTQVEFKVGASAGDIRQSVKVDWEKKEKTNWFGF